MNQNLGGQYNQNDQGDVYDKIYHFLGVVEFLSNPMVGSVLRMEPGFFTRVFRRGRQNNQGINIFKIDLIKNNLGNPYGTYNGPPGSNMDGSFRDGSFRDGSFRGGSFNEGNVNSSPPRRGLFRRMG
uniref:FMRFamide-related neuropeptide n=1 Tax=Strongyloides venezuelensis TaxID=75913 RepID=A0A0K0F4H6_STRVS